MKTRLASLVGLSGSVAGGWTLVNTLHQLTLLLSAVSGKRNQSPRRSATLKFAVAIPAHDEEREVAHAVESVRDADYPESLRRIVVIADNCSDSTAAVALAAGAEVLERTDPDHRGKGYALAWALPQLLNDSRVDAVLVVDADCLVSPNLLAALADRLERGADAVQAAYLISNPSASRGAALRWAGFALFNVVRPMGRSRLGLSCGLLGTGMAFSRDLLAHFPWSSFSFAEDREQHMRWVLGGRRVVFVDEAEVRSDAAMRPEDVLAQERRWESGRGALLATLVPRLFANGVRNRDVRALEAALEPALLPQAMLVGSSIAVVAVGRLTGRRRTSLCGIASVVGSVAYVTGGLAFVGAPGVVWRALLGAPQFVARRVMLVAQQAFGRGPAQWERTPRVAREPSEVDVARYGGRVPSGFTRDRVQHRDIPDSAQSVSHLMAGPVSLGIGERS